MVKAHNCFILKIIPELQAEIVVGCAGASRYLIEYKFGWYRETDFSPQAEGLFFCYPKLI
jgi:hypothetical protein